MSLDDFNKHRRAIHQRLCEQLQQIAPRVEINQDTELLQHFKILLQLQPARLETRRHLRIVCVGDGDEVDTSLLHVDDCADDVGCSQGDVLHAGAVEEFDVFFDLGLSFAVGGLVDGHLDELVGGSHDDRLERGVFGEDVFVVD